MQTFTRRFVMKLSLESTTCILVGYGSKICQQVKLVSCQLTCWFCPGVSCQLLFIPWIVFGNNCSL